MDKAIQLVKIMNSKGLETNLNIIGPQYPKNFSNYKKINVVGFLDKQNIIEREKMNKYLLDSHFNIMFSKAEGYGVVFAEASAFGLYSISHDIGGISQVVINNKNGYLFNTNDRLDLVADYLIRIFKNRQEYYLKSYNARMQFEKKLNWNYVGMKFKKIIINNIM